MDLELTKAVGVSNYGAKQLEEAQALLGDIPIAANQIKYSMLDRKAEEEDGLVSLAADMDVALVAYSPLEGGKLTANGAAKDPNNEKLGQLLKVLEFIGVVNGGKTVTQVALNYIVQKGLIPIPGCKGVAQAEEHAGVLGWDLDENEMAVIAEKLTALDL